MLFLQKINISVSVYNLSKMRSNNGRRGVRVNSNSNSGSETEPMKPISPVVRTQSPRFGYNSGRRMNNVNTTCDCFV